MTCNWFSHSILRQAQYKNVFKAINGDYEQLNIVNTCDILTIKIVVYRILNQ